MDKILNIEILGHPMNWLLILTALLFMWFALFTLANRLGLDKDDNKPAQSEGK
jgi:hypothetical protein